MILIGVTRKHRIGVDIVKMDPSYQFQHSAEYILTPAEKAFMQRTEPAMRYQIFFRIWALKEAILKVNGGTLTMMKNTDVSEIIQDVFSSPCVFREIPDQAATVFHLAVQERIRTSWGNCNQLNKPYLNAGMREIAARRWEVIPEDCMTGNLEEGSSGVRISFCKNFHYFMGNNYTEHYNARGCEIPYVAQVTGLDIVRLHELQNHERTHQANDKEDLIVNPLQKKRENTKPE